jgi:hypothetical protein
MIIIIIDEQFGQLYGRRFVIIVPLTAFSLFLNRPAAARSSGRLFPPESHERFLNFPALLV